MSTWFLTLNGTALHCAETGRCLSFQCGKWHIEVEDGARYVVAGPFALAMLAALGHRWDGAAIVPVGTATPAAPAMRCYAPDGTEYPAERWEECHDKWQEGMWVAEFASIRNGILCTVGKAGDDNDRANAIAPTIRAAFCAATTAYRKANP
jgi:hypothetical protein